jgi:hypothetical protein
MMKPSRRVPVRRRRDAPSVFAISDECSRFPKDAQAKWMLKQNGCSSKMDAQAKWMLIQSE